jgi:hypothetical protein
MRRSDSAVILYTDLKDYKDISLVYLNMASLYEGQRNVDSAAKYAARAKEASSKAKGGDAEMFHIDNTIFRIYVLGNRADDAKKLFKKLNKKVKGKDIDKEDKMGFYYYAWVYYNKLNQPEEGEAWKKQYDELKKQM